MHTVHTVSVYWWATWFRVGASTPVCVCPLSRRITYTICELGKIDPASILVFHAAHIPHLRPLTPPSTSNALRYISYVRHAARACSCACLLTRWRALACYPSSFAHTVAAANRTLTAHSHVIGTSRRHDCVAPPSHDAHTRAVSAGTRLGYMHARHVAGSSPHTSAQHRALVVE